MFHPFGYPNRASTFHGRVARQFTTSTGLPEFVAYREVPAKVMRIETSPPLTNNSTAERNIVENRQRTRWWEPAPREVEIWKGFLMSSSKSEEI